MKRYEDAFILMSTYPSSTVPYNRLQQVFCLNWLSNAAGLKLGTADQLTAFAQKCIPLVLQNNTVCGLIGTWSPVWGPIVTEPTSGPFRNVAANTMFVAQQPGENGGTTLVIAVAGTNPVSIYGWAGEDFDVVNTVPWSSALGLDFTASVNTDTTIPLISQGTANGLSALLVTMTDPNHDGSLISFLTKAVSTLPGPIEVVVTGHSLGGALSASLALFLADTQGDSEGWDPDSVAAVTGVSSAGAPPGNDVFALHFDAVLGTKMNRIWNQLDVIPHAWETDLLVQAPHLYFPYIAPNAGVRALVSLVLANTARSHQTYVQLNRQTGPILGQVDISATTTKVSLQQSITDEIVGLIVNQIGQKYAWSPADKQAIDRLVDAAIAAIEQFESAPGATQGATAPELTKNVGADVDAILSFLVEEAHAITADLKTDFAAVIQWIANELKIPAEKIQAILQSIFKDAKAAFAWLAQALETELAQLIPFLTAVIGRALMWLIAIADFLGIALSEALKLVPGILTFLGQLGIQHVPAYSQLMGTTAYTDLQKTIRANIVYPVT